MNAEERLAAIQTAAGAWIAPSSMLDTIHHLLSLIRFSHTIFALPFALLASVMAWYLGGFDGLQLLGILLCMVTARSPRRNAF